TALTMTSRRITLRTGPTTATKFTVIWIRSLCRKRQPSNCSAKISGLSQIEFSVAGHARHHIKQHPRPAFHLVHADAFVVAMLGVVLFRRRSIRIEPVSLNSQRTITLILRVSAGD